MFLFILPNFILTILIFKMTGWKFFQLSTPSTLSFFLGVSLFVLSNKNRKSLIFNILIITVISYWVYKDGYDIWMHKLNYNTYLGYQNKRIESFKVFTKNKKEIPMNKKDTFYILDFWTTSCGVCFKKFPNLNKLFEKYKYEKDIQIYAVNVPYKDESLINNYDLIRKREFQFPVAFFLESPQKIEVYTYPTVLIIRNDTLIHRGSIKSATTHLRKIFEKY